MKKLLILVLVLFTALAHAEITAVSPSASTSITETVQPLITSAPVSQQHIDKWGWVWVAVIFVVGAVGVYEHTSHPGAASEPF